MGGAEISEREGEGKLPEVDSECVWTRDGLEPAEHGPEAHQGANRTERRLRNT